MSKTPIRSVTFECLLNNFIHISSNAEVEVKGDGELAG
jgi:hypothetical protein